MVVFLGVVLDVNHGNKSKALVVVHGRTVFPAENPPCHTSLRSGVRSSIPLLFSIPFPKKSQIRRENAGTIRRPAYDCGFDHLSYFARDYKALFGEYPSETLRG
jgi:AraC-like DNA-binding protein